MTNAGGDQEAYRALMAGGTAEPQRLRMLTGSMAPEILPGDLLIVDPVLGRHVHLGDVAVFLAGHRMTAHRVLLVVSFGGRRWLLEKGDANPEASWIDERQVLGRVRAYVRGDQEVTLPRGQGAAAAVLRERRHLVYYAVSRRRYRW